VYRLISDIRLGLFSRPRSALILSGVTLVWSYFGSYFGSCVILTSVGSYMQNAPNQSPKVGLCDFVHATSCPSSTCQLQFNKMIAKGKLRKPQPPRAPQGDIQVATVVTTVA
jgi:hypothetical protein